MSTIITRNSANSGSVPSSLVQGELAINVTDGRLFYGSGSGNAVKEFGVTSSYALSSSYADTSTSASYAANADNAISSSYAQTASYAPDYLPLTGGTINGNVTVNGTASIAFLNVSYESASVIYSSGSNQFGDALNDVQTLWGTVDIKTGPVLVTGSLNVSGGITGSLLGTASYASQALSASYALSSSHAVSSSYALSASYALSSSYALSASYSVTSSYSNTSTSASHAVNADNAITASAILGGKATHVPYFITDTTLATSSIYQSGSSTIIINQDNATTANPEALYVWQPSTSSFNVISGKGNLNNYLQLNIQNTNQGTNASSDVVATADNGDENGNYIDMGINGENFSGFLGGPNDAYLYATGSHLHIGNATPNRPIQFFVGGPDTDADRKFELNANNEHNMTGSLEISGGLRVLNNITSSGLYTSGSNIILGNTTMSGSLSISGSSTIVGTTTMTGSLRITGSTTQTGNNTLIGNTTLSGSIIISGSTTSQPSVQVYGNVTHDGYIRFNPVSTDIDTSISASYIYVSGSTNDLYFSQNGSGYNNVTRLRWLEGNLYTGLLHGGLITTQSSTVYQISSGSGIIVNLNASLADDPFPTIQYLRWGNLSASIAPFTASYQQVFVGIDATNNIFAQGTPFSNGQFDTLINIGGVFFQNQSTINAVKTQPSVAYGFEQQQNVFNRAFGPLKLSGYTLAPSGSSTGSLIVGSGTAYAPGSNYTVDPNEPSYTVDNGTNISKIFRYRQSGSTWVYDTNAGAGYAAINPGQYSNNGVLTTVQPNDWSIQRVFWFPNSVVKAIVVYYGNASYSTEADAIANIGIEPFVEAPNTSANAIYLGAIVIRGNGVLSTPADFTIVPGGLFRQVGGSGGGGSIITQTLAGLSDVLISGPTNGQPLVYNSTSGKWQNSSTLTASLSGNATTATTASYIDPTFISASAAASGFGSGGSVDTGSLLTTASFNAYTGSNTSQFAGTASHAITAENVTGTVTTALTASYANNFTIAQTLTLDETLTDFAKVNSTIVGSNNLFQQATGSYTSAHGKYTLYKGTDARAGEFVTVWNGASTEYYDNSTRDIGNTTDITFQSLIVTGQIQINAVAASSGWTVKMITTYL